MHFRSHNDGRQEPIQQGWKAQIAVMQLCKARDGKLEDDQLHRRDPQNDDLRGTVKRRQDQFPKMKTQGRGRIQVKISMVDVMKAPKEGHLMQQPMPDKKSPIEGKDSQRYSRLDRKVELG